MAAESRTGGAGFGKRGAVRVPAGGMARSNGPGLPGPEAKANGAWPPSIFKWIGGGLAVMALAVMLAGTGGGGGLLGGLIGGAIASRLMQGTQSPAVSRAGGAHGEAGQSVSRGGFGATAASHSGSSAG